MTITIIAAVTANGALGRGGDLLYHISADLKRFKALTSGHTVVMGRKTFESFPKGALPDRRNIVITRDPAYCRPGIETAPSLEAALALCDDTTGEVFILGGGEIYRQAMAVADTLQLTEIDATVSDADTFFPAVDPAEWKCTLRSEPMTDPRSGVTYRFATYLRNS